MFSRPSLLGWVLKKRFAYSLVRVAEGVSKMVCSGKRENGRGYLEGDFVVGAVPFDFFPILGEEDL